MKIALVGNIIIDHVWNCKSNNLDCSNLVNNSYINIGGVVNCIRPFKDVEGEIIVYGTHGPNLELNLLKPIVGGLEFKLQNTLDNNSTALILEDLSSNTKTSYVKWGIDTDLNIINNITNHYDWIHIAYIDTLNYLDLNTIRELKTKCNYLSLDFCTSSHNQYTYNRVYNIFNEENLINIIFGNPKELKPYRKLLERLDNTLIVSHTSNQCSAYINDNIYNFNFTEIKRNMPVLGAGDYLAGEFIKNYFNLLPDNNKNMYYINRVLKESCQNTTNFLKSFK